MLSKSEFDIIKSFQQNPCVSMYVPMELTGDYDKNRIRWKNACQKAQQNIDEKFPEAQDILAPARALINDEKFWAYQSKTLVGFYAKDFHNYYHLVKNHPEIVSVHANFYTYPLMQEISNDIRIFILAISENETKFYEAVQDGIYPVRIHDKVVRSYAEAMSNIEEKSSLQHHTTRSSHASFHTNGKSEDKDNIRTEQYLRRIDDGIMEIIHDEQVPMVLACVEEYYSIYKDITRYPYLSNHMIAGNPENLTPGEIHDNIIPLLQEKTRKSIQSFEDRYEELKHQNLTLDNLTAISTNAKYKNIEKVLVPYDFNNFITESEAEQLDDALIQIYESGGEIVFATENNNSNQIKAISRFELN